MSDTIGIDEDELIDVIMGYLGNMSYSKMCTEFTAKCGRSALLSGMARSIFEDLEIEAMEEWIENLREDF